MSSKTQGVSASSTDTSEETIRAYEPRDGKMVKMLIGQGVMEGLARSNQRFYTHPLTLAVWLLIGAGVDYYASYLPQKGVWLSYLSPAIGFALAALPILFVAEYAHRPTFTSLMRGTLGAPDLVALDRYYAPMPTTSTSASASAKQGPGSGVWVFQHKGEVVGVVALDARRAGRELGSVLGEDEGEMGQEGVVDGLLDRSSSSGSGSAAGGSKSKSREGLRKRTTTTPAAKEDKTGEKGTAQLRHLVVDIPVRRHRVGLELLVHALDKAFGFTEDGPSTNTGIQRVVVITNPFTPGGERILNKCGFIPLADETVGGWAAPPKLGLLGWQGRWMGVSRETWAEKRVGIFDRKK